MSHISEGGSDDGDEEDVELLLAPVAVIGAPTPAMPRIITSRQRKAPRHHPDPHFYHLVQIFRTLPPSRQVMTVQHLFVLSQFQEGLLGDPFSHGSNLPTKRRVLWAKMRSRI